MELIALIVIGGLFYLVMRSRRKPEPPPEPPDASPPAAAAAAETVPTFSVVALGAKGCGKTVFLASMFHRLNHRTPQRNYHLETDAGQRVALAETYGALQDTSKPWPAGTRVADMRKYAFDCVARDDSNAKHRVLRLTYLDFAGELLEREQEPGSTLLTDLAGHIEDAHALLGLIDGYRVLQLLRGERAGKDHFQRTLQPMIGFMQDASCPIHLVVTKWDLVRDFGEPATATEQDRLDRVIEAVMKFDHIRSLVYVHSEHQIVRLIPVSAVGSDFAEVGADGKVVKLPDGELVPMNVDVPLCAVLPDLFKQVEHKLDLKVRSELRSDIWQRIRSDTGTLVSAALARPAGMALQVAFGRSFGTEATTLFLDWMGGPLDKKGDEVSSRRANVEAQLTKRQQVRRVVMDEFTDTVRRLEYALPNSKLGRSW